MKIEDLTQKDYTLKAVQKLGFTTPTDIQEKTIPYIREGLDIIGKSQTGSGKTFAYAIPLVEKLDPQNPQVQMLVVTPTRELCEQVTGEIRRLTEFVEGLKTILLVGGTDMHRQILYLKKGCRIVVGTPGRICDHIRRRTLKLQSVKYLVLDEADEMLDMGFLPDVQKILQATSPDRQTIMFSATMPEEVKTLAKNFQKNPQIIEIGDSDKNLFIKQYFVYVPQKEKDTALKLLLEKLNPTTSLIFCNTKKMVDKVVKKLQNLGYLCDGLHGDKPQLVRKKIMKEFKNKNLPILVATDVAGRGIDVKEVDVVINYDIPLEADTYTHRIGRTGRAGHVGRSYLLLNTKNQLNELDRIQKQTSNTITEYRLPISLDINGINPHNARVIPKEEEKSTLQQPFAVKRAKKSDYRFTSEGVKVKISPQKTSEHYDLERTLDEQIERDLRGDFSLSKPSKGLKQKKRPAQNSHSKPPRRQSKSPSKPSHTPAQNTTKPTQTEVKIHNPDGSKAPQKREKLGKVFAKNRGTERKFNPRHGLNLNKKG